MAKPKVAISACLLGEKVRYDGQQKRAGELLADLGPVVEWVPVCPEVGAGLGTPREPMHLERQGGRLLVITNQTRRDHTAILESFASAEIARLKELGICGFIMKSRSPTCGLYDVPVLAEGEQELASGRFAFSLAGSEPLLPFADEQELATAKARRRFMLRVQTYARYAAAMSAPEGLGSGDRPSDNG